MTDSPEIRYRLIATVYPDGKVWHAGDEGYADFTSIFVRHVGVTVDTGPRFLVVQSVRNGYSPVDTYAVVSVPENNWVPSKRVAPHPDTRSFPTADAAIMAAVMQAASS